MIAIACAPIRYRELKNWKYELCADAHFVVPVFPSADIAITHIHLSALGELRILQGYAWDGPSGPTIDSPSAMRGSLAHDALYQLMRLGLLPERWREEADAILETLCAQDGMMPVRAGMWKKMVNWFAGNCAKAGSEKADTQSIIKEAP